MPQFNLSSATISTTFIEDVLYPFTGYVPFVYDDMYPSLMTDKQVREDVSLISSLTDPNGNVFTRGTTKLNLIILLYIIQEMYSIKDTKTINIVILVLR